MLLSFRLSHVKKPCKQWVGTTARAQTIGLTDSSSVLVSGWSDNGWLSGGHAVRMAMELCTPFLDCTLRVVSHRVFSLAMHKAWPELLKRMKAGKASASSKDRQLVVSARTWFCLYLFEHQYVDSIFN